MVSIPGEEHDMNTRWQCRAVVCVVATWIAASVTVAMAADRPNVILILADDLGYGDVGFHGCQDIPTPHLDALAASGVRFANGYSSHPFCSPMRAALMAGRYQHRFGYVTNVAFDPHNQVMGLPPAEVTVASRLRTAGYRTGMVGKWHLGAAAPFHPLKRGFDFFYGFLGGGHDYFEVDTTVQLNENYKAALDDNGSPADFEGYLTEVLTDQAIKFISHQDDAPYFLYVAYNAPHGPLQAPADVVASFSSIPDERRRTYAAMVHIMDQQIGRLLATVDARGERENTLVCFLSDNGGPEKANASDNGPLRGQKGDVFEGGIHVPFVMSMPGTLPAMVYREPVMSFDLSQTAIELAGGEAVGGGDAVNLVPFVLGERAGAPHEALFWRMANDRRVAVRRGKDKLDVVDGETMLFDLDADLGETHDLAASQQAAVSELTALFDAWNASNLPALFPSYSDYHKQLKAFHEQVREAAQAADQTP
jgi:arylsulfatase A-like enzyme